MEIAWGLVNSKLHFLWVIRPDSITGSDWKLVFPENLKRAIDKRGYIVECAPQKEVLTHSSIGGFWSHCGWNSTLESICEGVPLICRPCFGDQNVNSRYVSHVWIVGIDRTKPIVIVVCESRPNKRKKNKKEMKI